MDSNPFIPEYPELPKPPLSLYKYVSSDRVDVLERMKIRFTPLLSTNDIFEVRRTFQKFIGPKFRSALFHQLSERDFVAHAANMISNRLGIPIDTAAALAPILMEKRFGKEYNRNFATTIEQMFDTVLIPFANDDQFIGALLERLGKETLALSLTEDAESPVMWAHYAGQGRGFIIEFDSSATFFQRSGSGQRWKLQKVKYVDGSVDEFIDDPHSVLLSKLSHWSYEREWRLFATEADADERIESNGGEISLFSIPPTAVSGVIVGYQAEEQLLRRICAAAKVNFPEAVITRLQAERLSGQFISETISPAIL